MVTDVVPKKLEGGLQRARREKILAVHGKPDSKTPKSFLPGSGVKTSCKDFAWLTSWLATVGSAYGGRATPAYLQEHPEESKNIHVLM